MVRMKICWLLVLGILLGMLLSDGLLNDSDTPYLERNPVDAIPLIYGSSVQGEPLLAWKLGNGHNTLVLVFGLHGWEDAFPADGTILEDVATDLLTLLRDGGGGILEETWTVYIIPVANPDGLHSGNSCQGFGRCNAQGIDLNRSFPYDFTPVAEPRNYNGTAPLQAPEAQALAELLKSVQGRGRNCLVDIHGWYQQILTTEEKQESRLYQTLCRYFPQCGWGSLEKGRGYLSAWAGYCLDYEAVLFEFPGITDAAAFEAAEYSRTFSSAIMDFLSGE